LTGDHPNVPSGLLPKAKKKGGTWVLFESIQLRMRKGYQMEQVIEQTEEALQVVELSLEELAQVGGGGVGSLIL
jgi:hypothetical protein